MKQRQTMIPVFISILCIGFLLLLPTGFEDALIYQGADQVKAKVIEVDNKAIYSSGLIQFGEQQCIIEIKGGTFKNQQATAVNMLSGSLDADKIFKEGDQALVVVNYTESEINSITMIDHYRMHVETVLAVAFVLFLILFAGKTGIRAILSFMLTVLMLWKVLVPCLLKGINPVFIGLLITIFLTVLIISLVYGFNMKAFSAISGSVLGILTTCILGIAFTGGFQIHGAVMGYSETLLYSGYEYLDLTRIFKASIFIAASGAVMDLAVDVTSSVGEVIEQAPHINWKEAVRSGMNIGRAAMGTMTTTLLLAYSGGYILLLMVFMAQGTPIYNILNYKNVSAEILHTLVGSFGLVTVAPFTALTSGYFLTRKNRKQQTQESSYQ